MKHYTTILFLLLFYPMMAQEEFDIDESMLEETVEEEKKWTLDGYIKDLRTIFIDTSGNPFLFNSQIHNRLNFNWYINDKWTVHSGLRTQIFYGTLINTANPFEPFATSIDGANDDVLDMSFLVADGSNFVWHSVFDRLYVDYTTEKWQVRLGRQRINWGINTVWNPHDIFNAYSYFDFDYEERPGSDALRVQYFTGFASSVEVAIKAFDTVDEFVGGAMWRTNKWNYDFQFLGGVFFKDVVVGAGWAGSIGNVGFKGELTTFIPYDSADSTETAFSGTLGFDYSLDNSTYFSGGMLFNSLGTTDRAALNVLALELNAKNLYPYQYSFFGLVSYPFNPAISGSVSLIYSPSADQALFINPSLTYSIKDNWDIDLIGQLVFNNDENGDFGLPVTVLFTRLKWSF